MKPAARFDEKLSYAGCRFCGASIDEHAGPEKFKRDVEFPALSPIFIASNTGVSLCRVEPPLRPLRKRTVHGSLCYDDSVQVIPWETKVGWETSDVVGCLDLIRAVTPRKYRISERPGISKGESPYRHLPNRRYRALNYHGLIDRYSSKETGFCGIPSESSVIPLAAITIRQDAEVTRNQSTLSLSSIKRQIVGVHVAFREGHLASSLVMLHSVGEEVKYYVEAVTARRKDSEALVYVVLPTTRISILQPKRSVPINETESPKSRPLCLPLGAISSMIIRTVRCLRGTPKAPIARSFLLSGPPGVGKTFAVKQAYEVCQAGGPTLLVSLGSLLSSGEGPGEVSRVLVERFEKTARACNDEMCVAILFIDECDSLFSNKMVAGVFSSLLDQSLRGAGGWQRMVLVAATNHAESLPPFLRRPGRFDKEVLMKAPTSSERATILKSLIADVASVAALGSNGLRDLAEMCVGYVAADMVALIRHVFALALEETRFPVDLDTFRRAMVHVGASSLRASSQHAPPTISWSDIGSDPAGAQETLRHAIEWPHTKRDAFRTLGLQPPSGILLYGPPGCAKTTLARAAASAAKTAFIAFAPSDVYASSYLGEAEAVIRRAFRFARSATPCILFFDEIDSILSSDRGGTEFGTNRAGSAESRVLSTFLNEMDGIDGSGHDGVLVLGATNRPWTLDAALMRSGRFDKAIFVPLPDYEGRLSILKIYCRAWAIGDEGLKSIASDRVSAMMTGAEIVGACHAAALLALKHSMKQGRRPETIEVTLGHLREAFVASKPVFSGREDLIDFLRFEQSRQRASGVAPLSMP